jgi:hypothetical protein
LPGLPPDRLDILQRTMPAHALKPRPADLFERELPSLWLLQDTRQSPARQVIAIFNWEAREQSFDYPLDRLGLDASTDYAAFDYWSDTRTSDLRSRLQISVPAESCRILAVRPVTRDPQVLSTSRHVTQGIVDLAEERWDAVSRTLRGRSRVVAGQAYELRIDSRSELAQATLAAANRTAGVRIAPKPMADGLVRVSIQSPVSREVSWELRFR